MATGNYTHGAAVAAQGERGQTTAHQRSSLRSQVQAVGSEGAAGTAPTSWSSAGLPARRILPPHGQRQPPPRRRPMRTAIYARVSTQRQAQAQSIDQQI